MADTYQYLKDRNGAITVRRSKVHDAPPLAAGLRPADLQEIKSHVGEDPVAHIERSIMCSDPGYTILNAINIPVAVFGVIPDAREAGVGKIWMLASDEFVSYRYLFLRHCRDWIERLQQEYSVLWNYIDARNTVHIRWLKWCGFIFIRSIAEHGVERIPFLEFERVRPGL